ncbi:MAG: PQQ-binding-like beta-propeller repeat protein [Cyanobacteriota bacterium]
MFKRFLILTIIVIIVALLCNYSIHHSYKYLNWIYEYPKGQKAQYLTQNQKYILLTTKNLNNDTSFIHFINKQNGQQLSTFKVEKVFNPPQIVNDWLIVASKENESSDSGSIYVFDLKTLNLVWKDKFISYKWAFKAYNNMLFYVDASGILRNVLVENKNIVWKVVSDSGFSNSTTPDIFNKNLYICNKNQILIMDVDTSKIIHNFKTDYDINSCSFNSEYAAVMLDNGYIYLIDFLNSLIKWKYQHVLLFSKSNIDILEDKFLGLLSTINLSQIKNTPNLKVLNRVNQIIHIIDMKSGMTIWQKDLEYPLDNTSLNTSIYQNKIVIQITKGCLTAFRIDNGFKLWQFYSKEGITPKIKYTINKNKIFLTMNGKNDGFLYVIDLRTGLLINKIKTPRFTPNSLSPLIDSEEIFLTCNNNSIAAFNINKIIKAAKKNKELNNEQK